MRQDSDWKREYQTMIKEFDMKQAEWQAVENTLRKAIARLSISAQGSDDRLNQQLKQIQQFSRQKQDQSLDRALDKLSDIITALDADQKPQNPNNPIASSTLLLEMLQSIRLDSIKTEQLQRLCADLLKVITGGNNQKLFKVLVAQLSDLINSSIAPTEKASDLVRDIVFELISLLELNKNTQQQIAQQFPSKKQLTPLELQNLAAIINAQLTHEVKADDAVSDISIHTVISSLLEQLTLVQCGGTEIVKMQTKIEAGVEDDDWPEILTTIVDNVALTVKKFRDEKKDLEDFILTITEQLSEITNTISTDFKAQISGQEDTLLLQTLLEKGIAKIKDNVNSEQDITQLKTIIGSNISSIRDGFESFAHRAKKRYDVAEVRNKKLSEKILKMEDETHSLQQKLEENQQKLLYDILTGIHSRVAYDQEIDQELSRWQRYGTVFSYAIIDIDHFKRVNDGYGHHAGDKALKIIAQLMQKKIRKSDTLFRIGGEEFVLLMPNTRTDQASPLLTKLRREVAESSFYFKQKWMRLTLSAGLTESRVNDDINSIYERADAALYRAKNAGRDCQFVD